MNTEDEFLRQLLVAPDDPTTRACYAGWLSARNDPRAEILKSAPDLERICCSAWLESEDKLDDYLAETPELKPEAESWRDAAKEREGRRELTEGVDPEWLAFVNALGCSFEPFYFFNNQGRPRECQPDELPFSEPLGTRGSVVTFASDFRSEAAFDPGLPRDLAFLAGIELDECYFGAATCPVHPFLCEVKTPSRPLTGADVLTSLRASAFHSAHIADLLATTIPAPGYNAGDGEGMHNDEIHNDFDAQYIFARPEEDVFEVVKVTDQYGRPVPFDEDDEESDPAADVDEESGTHGALKRYVVDGQLWYVLLHTTPQPSDEFRFSRYAILFAVGLSPHGERLVGVVTHQNCHNLCD